MNNVTIGVMGGMGPDATIAFYQKLTKLTPAEKDQDHLHVIIDSYPQIPDRTAHILNGEQSPLVMMVESAKRLEQAGADYIVITCMTAHYFLSDIQKKINVPMISAFDTLNQYLLTLEPKINNVGILATSGSRAAKVFDNNLKDFNLIYPNESEQSELVMTAIYGEEGIKAGYIEKASELLTTAAERLIIDGAEVIIGGCTEIPLALNDDLITVPFIDPMEVLAKKLIAIAK